jgi:hypothetical protein
MTQRKIVAAYFITLLVLSFLSYLSFSLEGAQRTFYLGEGNIVESLSAIGYLVCVIFVLYKGGLDYLKKHYFLIIAMLLLFARELDLDKRFTTKGVLTIKLYVHPEAPMIEKIIGVIVIVLLITTIVMIIKQYAAGLFKSLMERSIVTFGIVMTMILLVFAKTIDGLPRKLEPFGVEFGDLEAIQLGGVEEVFELGIPVFIFLTFYTYFWKKRSGISEQ